MLKQVLKGNKYAKSATRLLTELSICNFIMPDKPLDPMFDIKNLAILLTYNVKPTHLPTSANIRINAVTTSQRQNNSCSP